jgi:zinc protease
MRHKFIYILILFISGVSWPAGKKPETPPAADVMRTTLKNGLRVVIIRNSLAPVVTTEVNYLVGSNEAPDGFPGMAHAQEHMMFRGSPDLTASQLAEISAALGGNFNADTQQTVTQYFFTVPAEDLEIALHIEAIRMQGVSDSAKLWQQERGAIEQEVARDLSNPEYLFYSKLLSLMFAGSPYAHDALGTRASFEKTTAEMLKKFHEDWYSPNNAILVIAGDVDFDRTIEQVRRLFEPIPPRPVPPRAAVQLKPLRPAKIEFDTDLPYSLAAVAYRFPGYSSPDFAAGQILRDVLGSQRGNLYALVPEGKALSVEFSGTTFPHAALGYAIAAFPPGKDGEALIRTMKRIVADYLKAGVPGELVEAAKRREVANAEFRKNSIAGLANAWSQALAVEGRNSVDDDVEAFKKVTADDVNRVARKYLVNDTAIVADLAPRPSGKPLSPPGFVETESSASKPAAPVTLPDWAKRVLAVPGIPKSDVKPAVVTLANGLRIMVQPETISPTVSVYGRIKSNPEMQEPRGKEGISELLEDLLAYGTTSKDRLAFQKALDDLAAEETVGTHFSLRIPDEHFEQGMALLSDNLLHPALPEKAFKTLRKQAAAAAAGRLQSPGYLAKRALDGGLYPPGDHVLRQATPATIGSITSGDLKAYYEKVFRPDMTIIVVIGNVTTDRARKIVEKYFDGWKVSGPKPETNLPGVPPNKPSSSAVPDASRVQDQVTLVQTLGLTRLDPDYYTLQLGNHVLSGAFYATRLYRDLREQTGLVYNIDSLIKADLTRATYAITYACDPENVSKARALIERDLGAMQTSPVPPDELNRAKTLLLRQIPLSESSVHSIAAGLLDRSLLGLPIDEPVQAAKRYRETTAAEVQAAFAKWIRLGDFVQVTLGPLPKSN